MPTIEILFVLPINFISERARIDDSIETRDPGLPLSYYLVCLSSLCECTSIDGYRDRVALLAIESPYTDYLAIIQMPSFWQAPAVDLSLNTPPLSISLPAFTVWANQWSSFNETAHNYRRVFDTDRTVAPKHPCGLLPAGC
jgi:hypothetical protein